MGWGRENYGFEGAPDELAQGEGKVDSIKLEAFSYDNGLPATTKPPAESAPAERVDDSDIPAFQTTRRIIIEPSMIFGFMIHVSNYMLISQYVYYAIGEKYNLTAVMAAESNHGNGSGGKGCGGMEMNKSSVAYILQQKAQAESARFNLYIDIVTDVPGFIVILFFGTLMDQMGRKLSLILPLCGLIFRALLYVLQMVLPLPLEVLLLSGVVESATGGFSTFMTASYAVLADVVPGKNRARRLAINDILLVLAMAVMNFGMGVMIEHLGFMWPFVLVMVAHVMNLIYIVFFVPETGKKTGKCSAVSPRYILDLFKVVTKKREGAQRKLLYLLLSAWLIIGVSNSVHALDSLYKLNSPFCWTAQLIGTFMAISSLVPAAIQMVFAAFFLKRTKEINVILFSLVSMTGSSIVTGTATNSLMLWIAPLVGCFGGLSHSLLRAIISRQLPPSEQGSIFAFLIAMSKITGIGASAMYNNVYAATLYVYKGTVYLMMAGFMVIVFVLLVIFKVQAAKQQVINEEIQKEEAKGDVKSEAEGDVKSVAEGEGVKTKAEEAGEGTQ